MNAPWIREDIVDALTDARQTVVTLHSVCLPDGWTQGVPFGTVVPIGGAYCEPLGLVEYPIGYFAKPISAASSQAYRGVLDHLIATYGEESSTADEKLSAVASLAHALFDDYYGREFVLLRILPYLSAGGDTVQTLIAAACNASVARFEIARGPNSGPPA